ncbi:copper chaperone PCu(A)C [Gemmobacter fulvus]|uniref:copper chaperone PCu(A)C n=1 Tax=Gemmobacter fulvus TaxID=2840474 RepID=UPI002796498E|nr:copper chaperone PCu(A)C [Gemmobacter fulvus]MDQ1847568.1 copper chaperone PCu(A)C [Gemmobacter fulvus]
MRLLSSLVAATLFVACPVFADGIQIKDAYARSSGHMAKSGAAFMVIENQGSTDDRLIAASADFAKKVELHTHRESTDGVMQMVEVPEGFAVAAGQSHALARGGDHVMFMGLTRSLNQGDVLTVTLTFEKAGEMAIEVPVDLNR